MLLSLLTIDISKKTGKKFELTGFVARQDHGKYLNLQDLQRGKTLESVLVDVWDPVVAQVAETYEQKWDKLLSLLYTNFKKKNI